MRKILSIVMFSILFVCVSRGLYAGGRNYNGNQSAEFCKTMARHATFDTDADNVIYNPAGTSLVPDGLYIYVSNQLAIQPIDIKVAGGHWNNLIGIKDEYKGSKDAYIYPNICINYKKNNFAWSLGYLPVGGGGDAKYPDGLQMIDASLTIMKSSINSFYFPFTGGNVMGDPGIVTSNLKIYMAIHGIQTGLSFVLIKDKLSLFAGYRFMYGDSSIDMDLYAPGTGAIYYGYLPFGSKFRSTQNGMGHGAVLSVCIKPIENLMVSLKGEWMGQLRLRTKSSDWLIIGMLNPDLQNGKSTPGQLPANANIGIAYRVGGFQISGSFVYNFNQFSNWNGTEKGYTGGIDVAAGIDYSFQSVPINLGIGYAWAKSGVRPSARDQFWEELDSHNLSAGISYSFLNGTLKLTISELIALYNPADVNAGNILRILPARIYKKSYVTAIGVSYKAI